MKPTSPSLFKYGASLGSHFHKSIRDGLTRDALPRALLLVHGGTEAILTVAMIHHIIYNKWEINPEYEKVLSLTYPS